jgi:hypothetical protein
MRVRGVGGAVCSILLTFREPVGNCLVTVGGCGQSYSERTRSLFLSMLSASSHSSCRCRCYFATSHAARTRHRGARCQTGRCSRCSISPNAGEAGRCVFDFPTCLPSPVARPSLFLRTLPGSGIGNRGADSSGGSALLNVPCPRIFAGGTGAVRSTRRLDKVTTSTRCARGQVAEPPGNRWGVIKRSSV